MYSNIVSHYHANFDCPYLQHEREQVMTTNVWLTQVRQIIKKKNNNLTLNNWKGLQFCISMNSNVATVAGEQAAAYLSSDNEGSWDWTDPELID